MGLLLSLVLIGAVICFAACSSSAERPASDHFNGKTFFNPHDQSSHGFLDYIKMRIRETQASWPKQVENLHTPALPASVELGQIALTYVNHASFLVQMKNLNLLTDPVWAQRTSPFSWAGPKRVRPPGVALEQLPAIDLIIVSHNHFCSGSAFFLARAF